MSYVKLITVKSLVIELVRNKCSVVIQLLALQLFSRLFFILKQKDYTVFIGKVLLYFNFKFISLSRNKFTFGHQPK